MVATDSSEIFETVQGFGGQAVMTSPDHQSGSDRVAEATSELDAEIIVNLQGDEPELGGEYLDRLIRRLLSDDSVNVATLATPIRSFGTVSGYCLCQGCARPPIASVVFQSQPDSSSER